MGPCFYPQHPALCNADVRLHSQGSTYTALNRYTEVEVYGIPLR